MSNVINDFARQQIWGSMGNKKRRPTLWDGLWGDFQWYVLGIKDRKLPSVIDVGALWLWDQFKPLLGVKPAPPDRLPAGFPASLYNAVAAVVAARGGTDRETGAPLFWVDKGACSVTPFSYVLVVDYSLSEDPGKIAGWEKSLEDRIAGAGFRLNVRIAYSPLRLEIDKAEPPTVRLADYWQEIGQLPTNQNLCAPGVVLQGGEIGLMRYALKNDRLSNAVVGSPGSGKTQLTLGMILSLCYCNSPDHMALVIVDPKVVDWLPLRGLPHLAAPIATTGAKGAELLLAMVSEMENRMRAAEDGAQVADMKLIVAYVDEMADLIDGLSPAQAAQVVNAFKRLSQTGRGLRIGLIGATQRIYDLPAAMYSKLNGRFVGKTATANDGAAVAGAGVRTDRLPGKGAFEFYPGGQRLQGFMVADPEKEGYAGELARFARDIEERWRGVAPHWRPNGEGSLSQTGAVNADQAGPAVDQFLEMALAEYLANPQGFTKESLRRLHQRERGTGINGTRAAQLWDQLMAYGRAKFNSLG